MTSQWGAVDVANVQHYIGQTVFVELHWDDEPESFWQCLNVVGVVLPMEGVYQHAYFLTMSLPSDSPYPNEVFFSDIRTIRVIRHRDRHSSGNVLGRIALPKPKRSRAALPARRNSFTVPSNGSTGAAHP
ncbi:hypothetical protein JNA64_13150 [Pseudomonas stutzeri]|uniref:hypothetical protein n=1 Tax=Stutzerimonas stutzeri TaxID=316 RepID=UPI001F51FD01|nr:hypothetical protein [Stutzerimonas stutzeri]MCI0918119.1 hypothetical protein [Stutzerimonas stutzeri]